MFGPRLVNLGTLAGLAAPLLGLGSFLVLEGDAPADLLPFLIMFVAPFELGFVLGRMAPWRGARAGALTLAFGLALGAVAPIGGPGVFLAAGLAVALAMPDLGAGETRLIP